MSKVNEKYNCQYIVQSFHPYSFLSLFTESEVYDGSSSRNEELGLNVIPDATWGFHPSERESLISDATMSSDAVAHSYEPETGNKPQKTITMLLGDKHHHRYESKYKEINVAGCRTSMNRTDNQPSRNEFGSAHLSQREDDLDGSRSSTEFQDDGPSHEDSTTKQGICSSRSDRKRKLDRSQGIFEHSHQSGGWLLADEDENSDDDLIYTSLESVGHQREGLDSSQDGVKKQKIFVMSTNNDKVSGRRYDKMMYCLYCSKPQSKITRHIKGQHSEEPDVVKYMTAKTQEEENYHLTMIRNRGNHLHNCDVMEKGEGQLVAVHRPSSNADPNDYHACRYCFGWFARTESWRHRCVAKREEEEGETRNGSKGKHLYHPYRALTGFLGII